MTAVIKSKRGGPRPNSGGARPGAGRKPTLPPVTEDDIARDLVFPALCVAFRAQPDKWGGRLLEVELSKTDIKSAYGELGLSVWVKYFKMEKIGGRDRFGVGYKTRWTLHLGHYAVAKMLVESLGHTIKDLPNPGFPPAAVIERLNLLAEKRAARAARAAKKANAKETT